MTKEITIENAQPGDAPQLANLLSQLGYPTKESDLLIKFSAHQAPGYKILVARKDKMAIGFICLHYYQTFHLPGPVGRITSFCVDSVVRKQGVGGMLLLAAEEYFKQQPCYKIEVTSNFRRSETHEYYLRQGYTETNRHFVKLLGLKSAH
ncbi:MAG: GNAT family N-acetyltransferase [Flammeovirgaceae bacterium]|nr:GNAT family N-acetyltransferase [Flammeovirgaceae bacterium]